MYVGEPTTRPAVVSVASLGLVAIPKSVRIIRPSSPNKTLLGLAVHIRDASGQADLLDSDRPQEDQVEGLPHIPHPPGTENRRQPISASEETSS